MNLTILSLFCFIIISSISYSKPFASGEIRYGDIIEQVENNVTKRQQQILLSAHKLVSDREIIKGSCWNWLDSAYRLAGFEAKDREVIFKSKKSGPYANLSILQSGDWIYHINHSYNDIEHSGMFITWLDRAKNLALMLSYGGERRKEPARYRPYDITHTYYIIRPKENKMQRVPAWIYARQNKMSLFQVIKKINNNELKGEVLEENGKKVQYVLVEEDNSSKRENNDSLNLVNEQNQATKESKRESDYEDLRQEIKRLRLEIEQMKQMLKEFINKSH